VTQSLNFFLSANNQPPSKGTPQQPSPLIFFIFPSSTASFSPATVRTRVHPATTASLQSPPGKLLCLSYFTSCKNSLVLSSLLVTTSDWGCFFFPCLFLTLMLILVWLDLQAPSLTAILICSVLTAQNRGKILSFLPCPFLTLFVIFRDCCLGPLGALIFTV